MKWAKERDVLIAQTKAFVQSVTGRRPDNTVELTSVEMNRTEPARTDYSGFTPRSVPADSFESIEKVEQTAIPVVEAPPVRVLPHSEVRREIQNRVAAFQAHQHRFHREREAYFKSVLIKVRSAIENGPDAPSA
jgi:hypothetical protein